MSRQYSPKSFLRQVPNHLLKEFFDRKHQLKEVPWASLKETHVGLIYAAWQDLPPEERAEVEGAFQAVHEMACAEGVQALVEEGHFHSVDLARSLDRLDGHAHKAMFAYLNYERIFKVASCFLSADMLPGRYWLRHKVPPALQPETSSDATKALAEGLAEFYRETQGRGHRCTVETYLRSGRQHYYFAYPDDYTDTYIGHDEHGQFVRRPQKRAFENVFVYDPGCGALDMYAQGDRGVKSRLLYIFCQKILGENPTLQEYGDHAYELNGLLSRDFSLATDAGDGIKEVRITKLRLSLGGGRRRITLEGDPERGPHDVHDMIDEHLNAQRLGAGACNVTQAQFQVVFCTRGSECPKPMSFCVTFPNSSNYRSLPEEHRVLAEKYLKRWGIDRG